MKILFIYPSAESQLGFNYGAASMSALLKGAGHDVVLWQLCEEFEPLPTQEEFARRVAKEKADVLAFSVVTNQWPYTQQLARWARSCFGGPIVLGGVHALTGVEVILETGLFDYVFRGECEEAFLEFIEKIAHGDSVAEVANLASVQDGQMQVNPVRPLPLLRELPRKDYEIMDFQKMIDAKDGWVGLMASRGCPFSCTYCFNHQMVAAYKADLKCGFRGLNYVRHHDVSQVIGEIEYLLENYKRIKMFIFDDDLFTYDKGFVRDFCRAYRDVSDLPFVVNAHVEFFGEGMAGLLAEAGCRIVKFGVESGSEDIRRRILNRHMSNQAIVEAIGLVGKYGMHSSVFLIIGFPYETRENVYETIELMAGAKPGRFRWTFFYPFPGTRAHEISEEGGFIDREAMGQLQNFTDRSCLDFGAEQNLFLRKVGKIMPWFVNAASAFKAAAVYRERVDQLLEMDATQWERHAEGVLEEDKILSHDLAEKGMTHYAVKYNRFMGVISDYFLNS